MIFFFWTGGLFKKSHPLNLSDSFPHDLGCFFVDVRVGKRVAKFQGLSGIQSIDISRFRLCVEIFEKPKKLLFPHEWHYILMFEEWLSFVTLFELFFLKLAKMCFWLLVLNFAIKINIYNSKYDSLMELIIKKQKQKSTHTNILLKKFNSSQCFTFRTLRTSITNSTWKMIISKIKCN